MKKAIYWCIIGLLAIVSCKKLSDLLTFEISNTENITVPATTIVSAPIISPVPVTLHSQETFENNKTKAELVKDVRLKKLTLTIADPSSETFNFLESIRIFIGTDQNDKVLLASLDDIPFGVSAIDLVSSNTRLDSYIKASSYTLYTEVSVRSTIGKKLSLRADSKFQVTADPF